MPTNNADVNRNHSAEYVILGGGMVAGYAAKELVKLGLKSGELMIVSADDFLPYERPPLSKGFLSGKDTEESVFINRPDFYREHGIEVKLETTISSVDLKNKRLQSSLGEDFSFQKLLLATGARPRTLDVPGDDLTNVFYLRSLADSRNIRSRASTGAKAVVIGGGFIGMEVASVLAQKKIETTIVIQSDRVWDRVFTPAMSAFFEPYYQERGVKLIKQASVAAFEGQEAVQSVRLADGRKLPCDLVVAGVGALPVTELFAKSGIAVNNGVVVNEYLETAHPGVYAAGDMANYPDPLFGKRRRVEHWDNAVSQGEHAAQMMLGGRKPFDHVPYFFSDVFDLSYELWGDTAGSDQTVVRGDLNTPSFSVWWLKNNQLVAAFVMNRPDDERSVAPEWIRAKRGSEDLL
ncbi:MAG TPA: FAD/NAD(P)-binding oxidoreductase [Terriglobia bacterium]|nr:FAD/NAD(P)-binding oxidoreductase [Terriglobia bacterium]